MIKNTFYIKTKRTYLRTLNAQNASDFYYLNSDVEILKYTGNVPFDRVEGAKAFLENKEGVFYAISCEQFVLANNLFN